MIYQNGEGNQKKIQNMFKNPDKTLYLGFVNPIITCFGMSD